MKHFLKLFILIIMVVFFCGCLRAVPESSVKPLKSFVEIDASDMDFADDLDPESLKLAIDRSINFYEKAGRNKVYRIDDREIDAQALKETLLAFRDILSKDDDQDNIRKKISEAFNVFQATGSDDEGRVLFTGYYEPLLEGSLERTDKYKYPIYQVPPDLVIRENQVGRMADDEFVPYYSRREIDIEGVLREKNLELVWVSNALDLFSLHIQGSGKVQLEDGTVLTVGFAQTNGRPFRSVTKFMLEEGRIQTKEASYRHDFLRGKSDQEIYDVLSHNERYTFFRLLENDPIGSLGEEVTPDRSIATDPDFFPEGALAFIRLSKPVFDTEDNIKKRINFSRFVLSQDKGAAIKGPGRVDIFCGFGKKAECTAGTLKEEGELYLLLKK